MDYLQENHIIETILNCSLVYEGDKDNDFEETVRYEPTLCLIGISWGNQKLQYLITCQDKETK